MNKHGVIPTPLDKVNLYYPEGKEGPFSSFNSYQDFTDTVILPNVADNIMYSAIGMAGECGEVCEIIKKNLRDGKIIDKNNLTKELGDVMFYIARVARCAGISMADIALTNKTKLEDRKARDVIQGSGDSR